MSQNLTPTTSTHYTQSHLDIHATLHKQCNDSQSHIRTRTVKRKHSSAYELIQQKSQKCKRSLLQACYNNSMHNVIVTQNTNTTLIHSVLFTVDILYHIFDYIEFKSILQLSSVCKTFHHAIHSTDVLTGAADIVQQHIPYIQTYKSLNLRNLPHNAQFIQSLTMLDSVTIDFSNINVSVEAKISNIHAIALNQRSNTNTCIRNLALYDVGIIDNEYMLNTNVCHTIQRLTVTNAINDVAHALHYSNTNNTKINNIQSVQYPCLTYLNLTGCNVWNEQLFAYSINNVNTIILNQCKNVTPKTLNAITQYCKQLQVLELAGCTSYSITALQQLLQFSTQLHTLNISDCGILITDEITTTIEQYCTDRLRILHIAGCFKLTELGFQQISKCKHLTVFDASYCPKFDDTICSNIITECSELIELYVTNCYKITNDMLKQLAAVHTIQHTGTTRGIRILDLYATSITDDAIQYIVQCSTIHTLNLGNCNTITDSGIVQLHTMTQLKSLQLDNCVKLTGKQFHTLNTLVNMEQISIFGCSLFEERAIKSVIPHWTKLTFLNIRACSRMTYDIIDYIKTVLPNCTVEHRIPVPVVKQVPTTPSSTPLLRLTSKKFTTVKHRNRSVNAVSSGVHSDIHSNSISNAKKVTDSGNKYVIDLTHEFDHVQREINAQSTADNDTDATE